MATKYYTKDDLVITVTDSGYSIAQRGDEEGDSYVGASPSLTGYREVTAEEAADILGWDVESLA